MDPYRNERDADLNLTVQYTEDATLLSPGAQPTRSTRDQGDAVSRESPSSEWSEVPPLPGDLPSSAIQLLQTFQSCEPELSLPFENSTQQHGYKIARSSFEVHSDRPASQHSRSHWRDIYQVAINRWIFEILACVGSLVALFGMIAVLIVYDRSLLPNWPYGITINTVVALFSTAMKALMLVAIAACIGQAKWIHFHSNRHALADIVIYDSASRGPQGSIQFLWKFQARHLACLGALITILAMSLDPLVQQVISIEARRVTSNHGSSLNRAQSFLQYNTDPEGAVHTYITFDMLGALYSGIFSGSGASNEASFTMNPSCPTGNCTFPLFQSLAVCHYCGDITDTIQGSCQKSPWYIAGSGEILCQYHLPNGLKLNSTGVYDQSTIGPVATSGYLGLVSDTAFGNTLLSFTRISRHASATETNIDVHNLTAQECVLYWCVNTYEADVTNGALNEKITQSWHSNVTEWRGDGEYPSVMCLDLLTPAVDNQSATSIFRVAYLAHAALADWLVAKLSVSNSFAVSFIPYAVLTPFDVTANKSVDTQDTITALWQPDINATFSNLAASITRNIREVDWETQTYGDGFIEPVKGAGAANGTAWSLEIAINVRWPWLILPISLIAMTVLFLILTAIETARTRIEVWKSSPVPLLFHGLENTEAMQLRMAAHLGEMERIAEKVPVRLEETDTGWKLVR